ncbi:MAG: DDE-type integrase/transposase/recombinase [Lutispora sp.]
MNENQLTKVTFVLRAPYGKPLKFCGLDFYCARLEIPLFSCNFVAIDRATRSLFYRIYEAKTSENTEDFMNRCFEFFPFEITHVLTDNGPEFTNRLIKSKKGKLCQKSSKLNEVCKTNHIEHRLT